MGSNRPTESPSVPPPDGQDTNKFWRDKVFLKNFIAGSIAAFISDTVVCPLDRVKLMLQVQALKKTIVTEPRREVTARRGIIQCFQIIIARQGVSGLWRGHSASLLHSLPSQAFTFALKDKLTTIISKWVGKNKSPLSAFMVGFASGSIVGACVSSLLYPLDHARTKMAADMTKKEKRGRGSILGVLATTYSNSGIRGVYRGLSLSVLGVIIYRGCYFGLFDFGMRLIPGKYRNGLLGQLIPAFSASCIASLASYPVDTLRRNMILKKVREGKGSVRHVATKIYGKTGIQGFYAGSLANLLRSTGGGIMLVSYNILKSML